MIQHKKANFKQTPQALSLLFASSNVVIAARVQELVRHLAPAISL